MVGLKTLKTLMYGWIPNKSGMNNIQEKKAEYTYETIMVFVKFFIKLLVCLSVFNLYLHQINL